MTQIENIFIVYQEAKVVSSTRVWFAWSRQSFYDSNNEQVV